MSHEYFPFQAGVLDINDQGSPKFREVDLFYLEAEYLCSICCSEDDNNVENISLLGGVHLILSA